MIALFGGKNTFATPINQQPLALGADLVVHSATKYLGGHADALGGALCGRRDLVRAVFHFREITGATLDPMSAYLLLRGMKTLHLRIRQQNASAMQIAEFLQAHPAVTQVFYPGLPSHQHHAIARQQMRGFGGVLSFTLNGGFDAVRAVLPGDRQEIRYRGTQLALDRLRRVFERSAGAPGWTTNA